MKTVPDQREDAMPPGFAYGLLGALAVGVTLWALAALFVL